MSYLVLARKWRPQTFDEVVGQAHVTRTLQNAIRAGRVAHAYLFTGARGVGKTSVARILAKSLNCEPGVTVSPCNVCSNCKEITQGHSVDVLEIDGASNRGIDSIRELRETVRYRPSKSRNKVYIIDEVHMLTTEAFNALLKTLEEPPEHVIFIFATTEPHKIPSTILSRCQRFDFRRIDTLKLLGHMKTILVQEQVALSESVLYSIAREADGSMRDAQSLLEQLLAFSGDGLSDQEILDVLGIVDRRSVQQAAGAVLDGDTVTCLQVVDDVYRRGIDSRRFCQQLCDFFRSLLWLAVGQGKAGMALDLPETEAQFLKERLACVSPESLHLYLQTLLKGEEEIRRSALPRLSLEMLLLRMSQLPRLETLNQVVDQVQRLERILAGMPDEDPMDASIPVQSGAAAKSTLVRPPVDPEPAPFPREVDHPAVSAASPVTQPEHAFSGQPVTPEQMLSRWSSFVQWVCGRDERFAAKLSQSSLREVSGSSAELEVLEVYENLFQQKDVSVLADLGEDYFGVRLDWHIRTRASLRDKQDEEGTKSRSSRSNPRRLVMESTAVQQAIEILGGELIEVRSLGEERPARGRGHGSGTTE
jgi:DNA polymerase-3 subunit gamma/tau